MKHEYLGQLNLDELHTITREHFASHFDEVLEMVNNGCSPICIIEDGKNDLLLFDWDDYMRRFSALLSPEDLEVLSQLSDPTNEVTTDCSHLDEEPSDKE